jgi:hypothetical protein
MSKVCDFPKCEELGPVGIQNLWVCLQHIDWAMAKAFKPGRVFEELLKECKQDADA